MLASRCLSAHRRRLRVLLLAGALLGAMPRPSHAQESAPSFEQAAMNSRMFEAVERTVTRRFHDKNFHGTDWAGHCAAHQEAILESPDQRTLHERLNRLLGTLNASHTVLIDERVYERHFAPEMGGGNPLQMLFGGASTNKPPVTGLMLVKLDAGYFVSSMYDGGPAEKSGLKVGDQILALDGVAPEESPRLLFAGGDTHVEQAPAFFVEAEADERITLEFLRTPDDAVESVTLSPAAITATDATRNSVRVIEREGYKLGYVHAWHFLNNDITRIVRDAMRGPLKDCDALIFDLRGRGGQPMVIYQLLGLFGPGKTWEKPVTCLQDEHSRSAKEVFSYLFQQRRLGLAVGRPTEGAVLGSTFFKMPDGSQLLLAVQNVRQFTAGVELEGHPVKPHIHVEGDSLAYQAGKDAILEQGLHVTARFLGWRAGQTPESEH